MASRRAHLTGPTPRRPRRRRRSRTCAAVRPRRHGYLVTASSPARVRFSPALFPCGSRTLGSRRVSMRKFCALASKPPYSAAISSRARSPLWPYGGCPMSWASPAMSTRSGSQPRPMAIPRPIWATSNEWVNRVRGVSPWRGPTTWVLSASLRSAAQCSTLARSRAKSVRCSVSVPGSAAPLRGSTTSRCSVELVVEILIRCHRRTVCQY